VSSFLFFTLTMVEYWCLSLMGFLLLFKSLIVLLLELYSKLMK